MGLLVHRRDAPPRSALAQVPRHDRVLTWADVDDGTVVLVTPAGIWWPQRDESTCMRLIGWQHVNKVVWHGHALSVTEAEVVDDLLMVDRAPVRAVLSRPRHLPPIVRKRVEANVVRSEVVAITGGRARFVARRVPGENGVHWWARLEDGTADTAAVRSAVSARLAILRSEWAEQVESVQRW
jgi:hypothetical protein